MLIDHWATTQKLMEDTGLSTEDILKLDAGEYARLTGRMTPSEAAMAALGYTDEPVPGTPRQEPPAPAPQPQAAPQGLDPNSNEYFHAWRANRVSGGEGKGIFDSTGTDAWVQAARAKTGRTQYGQSNTQGAPQIGRAFVQHTQPEGRQSLYQGS